MRKITYILAGAALAVFMSAGAHAEDEVNEIDPQKVFYGDPGSFEKAAEVDLREAVRATPEYAEIERRNLDTGTGSYWLQIERASNRSLKVVIDIGQESEFDLIVEKGHLAEVDEDIPVEDITEKVVSYIEERR